MIIGVPKEIKTDENRIGLTPGGVGEFKSRGHKVLIEKEGGQGSNFSDDEYIQSGAEIVSTPEEIFERSEMIVKVKEPQPEEIPFLRKDQILFTFLHLAADKKLTEALLKRKITGIAYETIETDHKLPLLEPMSEIAGKMSSLMGAYFLGKPFGGKGILAGGVTGVHSAQFLIIGGGTAGLNAAKIAAGLGARVVVMDINLERQRYLEDVLPKNCEMIMSNRLNIEKELPKADVIIGAVLIPGARTPRLITRDMLKLLPPETVLVDISVDQGGCFETTRPTTHTDPVYTIDGVLHYCVANMPGAYPRSSTFALTNATLSYGLTIADNGWKAASRNDRAIALGVNMAEGKLTCENVANAHGLQYHELSKFI